MYSFPFPFPVKFILASSFLLTVAFLGGCSRKEASGGQGSARGGSLREQKQPVEVTQVVRMDLSETLNVVGSVAPNESAELRAEISGLVRGIFFEEGQPVVKGAVLLKIDDSELRAQLAQAEARFQLTELSLQRAENLRQTQSTTLAEYDRAKSEFASAKADLAVLNLRLEKTEIKAPFDGIVGARALSPGDYVTSQTSITSIDDLSRLKIEFQVPERYLAKVRPGTRFVVTSSSLERGNQVHGEVYFVSSVIDRSTRSSAVKGMLIEPPTNLKPGMFANIEVVLEVRKKVLAVPEGSILTTTHGTTLIMAREVNGETVAEFVPVQLGLRSRSLVEVSPLKGELTENSRIVASGVGSLILFPGAKLEPRPLKEAFRL